MAGTARLKRQGLRGLWIAAALVAAAPYALADQLVMPYRCQAFGRDVSLTPSESQTYEIYGRREQDLVTACAPNDPNRCRTWRIHRFDLNCGGSRVAWMDVVNAANAMTQGPARVRNGQLYVRMDPWWAKDRPPVWSDRGRPRDQDFDEDEDWRTGNMRYRPAPRAPQVEMPRGFAPVVGLNARFTGGPDAPGAMASDARGAEPGTGSDRAGDAYSPNRPAMTQVAPPIAKTPAVKPTVPKDEAPAASGPKVVTRDAGHTFEPKTAEQKPADTATQLASKDEKSADEKKLDTKPAEHAEKPAEVAAATPAPAATAAPATASPSATDTAAAPKPSPEPTINSLAPTILNRPGSEPAQITGAASSSGDQAAVSGSTATPPVAPIPATIETASLPQKQLPVFMIGAALLLIATTLAYFMRRQSAQRVVARERDLASVSLVASRELVPRPRTEATLSIDPVAAPVPPQPPTPPPAAAPAASLAQALLTNAPPPAPEPVLAAESFVPEWLPQTREDALQVLGAGPEASAAVLKKIVDGLRMSWHPDLATSPEEHRVRSERMAQINVAWDILSGRQPA